jgi:hypothetical protein
MEFSTDAVMFKISGNLPIFLGPLPTTDPSPIMLETAMNPWFD